MLGKCVPQLGVFLVLGLGLIQRLLGIVQGGLGIAQQGVSHLFQVDQQLDLLKLILKFQHLLFAAHQCGGTALHGIGQGGLLGGKLASPASSWALAASSSRCASVSFCSACANWRSASAFCSL